MNSLKSIFQRDQIAPAILSGIVTGFIEVTFVFSIASLLFSGRLAPYFPLGVGLILMTSIVTLLTTIFFNGMPSTISTTQELPALILALMLSSLMANPTIQDGDLLATAVVTLGLSAMVTGVFFYAVGRFSLTGLVRFVPYPVLGGFLAGTGWLIVQSAIGTMATVPLEWGTLSQILQPSELILWVPGVLIGFGIFIGSTQIKHFLALPMILIGSLVLYYSIFFMSGLSIEQGTEQGLFLGQVANDVRWSPIFLQSLTHANWGFILAQSGNYITLIMLALVNILLGLSSIELDLRTDMDVNKELRAAGIANMTSGLFGGIVGFQDLSQTTLNTRMGVRGRLGSVGIAIACLLVLLMGSSFLAFIPKAMLGGSIFYLGIEFVFEWIVLGYRKFNRLDYAIIWLIALVMAFLGLLAGVAVGLGVTVLVFVWQYSKISIFHQKLSGLEYHSNVERNPHHERELQKYRGRIYILELQGFIFFGTAYNLLTEIQSRLNDESAQKLHYVILDFSRVKAIDASAMLSFEKVMYLAELKDFTVVLADFTSHSERGLTFVDDEEFSKRIHLAPDLDRALEWCEEQFMDIFGVTQAMLAPTILLQLQAMGFDNKHAKKFLPYLEKLDLKQGDYLIKQGDEANDLFFIEIGTVSVLLETDKEYPIRVRTMNMGTIVGEVGFYLNQKRTASVVADTRSFVQRFSRESANRMFEEDPELAAVFHELMVKVIAQRLTSTNQTLSALIR